VRLGVDVDYKLAADTLLNISAHASTAANPPTSPAPSASAAVSERDVTRRDLR
jgi:hypothetical protein